MGGHPSPSFIQEILQGAENSIYFAFLAWLFGADGSSLFHVLILMKIVYGLGKYNKIVTMIQKENKIH